ncbi:MAG: GntR family transcriptional regulator [Novosphingobium sp.]|nr:GntR family transcriptional regulator [Novosphingobium sp.]
MNSLGGKTVRIPKIAEVIAGHIRRSILRGDIQPGNFLPPEAQLIADFEVSRPTVREAFRILEAEDLIRISRGARKGAQVLRPSSDMIARGMGIALQTRGASIADVYNARAAIEPIAARFAAEHNPAEASRRLFQQVELERRFIAARDVENLWSATSQYHRLLMEGSGNITLSLLGLALDNLVNRHLQLLYRESADHRNEWWSRMDVGIRSRQKLARLIEAGDGPGASAHWARHMESTSRFWLARIADTTLVDILS